MDSSDFFSAQLGLFHGFDFHFALREKGGKSHRPSRRAVTCGNAAGRLRDRGPDIYETPESATEALIRAEPLRRRLWESACGPHDRIGAVLRGHGYEVVSTDLVRDRIDFLMEYRAPQGVEGIVTNPPYRLANEFIRHSLRFVPFVAMLLRLNFLEGQGRTDIIDRLARIHVFADRLPRLHRIDWTGKRSTNGTAYAWLIWDDTHVGPTTIDRIWCCSRKRSGAS
jgi:hypothetical protein